MWLLPQYGLRVVICKESLIRSVIIVDASCKRDKYTQLISIVMIYCDSNTENWKLVIITNSNSFNFMLHVEVVMIQIIFLIFATHTQKKKKILTIIMKWS